MTEDASASQVLGLPEGCKILNVIDLTLLDAAREILEAAEVVAIDAEWEPYTSKASASLVQIATRNTSSTNIIVVLLDFRKVGACACKDTLQRLLRNRKILKVGFGLLMDLKAIATAIGGEGAGCVSVVQPYIDVKTLHCQLSASHIDGIRRDTGRGLSGVVEGQLGVCLDKSLQCSSWGSRPLSPEQLNYAALDAAVLLMLLDSIIAAALPSKAAAAAASLDAHQRAPQGRQSTAFEDSMARLSVRDGTAGNGDSAEGFTSQAGVQGPACSDVAGSPRLSQTVDPETEESAAASEGSEDRSRTCCDVEPRRHEHSACAALEADKSTDARGSPAEREHGVVCEDGKVLQQAASAAELQEAGEVWGIRLEVGGPCRPKPQKLNKEKRPGIRQLFGQDAASNEHIGRPARVPWLESGAPDAVPRFICDVMTEGLARQLRLCGIDARSAPVMGGRQRYQAYMELVYRATSENRIVLTADTVFLRARYTDQAYWVRATNKREQLLEVLAAFNIEVKEGSLLSRCAKCNGTFIPRALTKAQLPATCILSEGVRARHDCFYMCSNEECQKIYWQGNQYGNALENLAARVLRQPQQMQLA